MLVTINMVNECIVELVVKYNFCVLEGTGGEEEGHEDSTIKRELHV